MHPKGSVLWPSLAFSSTRSDSIHRDYDQVVVGYSEQDISVGVVRLLSL